MNEPIYRVDAKIMVFFLVVMLLAASAFVYRYQNVEECPQIALRISADTIQAGQMVMFSTQSAGVRQVQWDFGDNSRLVNKLRAGHTYAEPGEYILSMRVNGGCTEIRKLLVQAPKPLMNHALMPKISAPERLEINKVGKFRCLTKGAKSYEWRFGESGRVDSREANPSFRFSTPGIKNISLVIDGNDAYVARQTVHVTAQAVPAPPRQAIERDRAQNRQAPPPVQVPDAPEDYDSYDALRVVVRENPQSQLKVQTNDELVAQIKNYAQGAAKASQFKNSFCEKMESSLVEANGRLMKFPEFLEQIQGRNIRVKDFRTIRGEGGCVMQIIIRYKK